MIWKKALDDSIGVGAKLKVACDVLASHLLDVSAKEASTSINL
jgi:hypothetical protein